MGSKNNSPLYLVMIAVLGSGGVNLSKTDTVIDKIANMQNWQSVAEYRISELETQVK